MLDFSREYDSNNFTNFLRNFLPDETEFLSKELVVEKKFSYFNKITYLAFSKSLKDLQVIEIEHNASDKNRIILSREIFKFMSSRGSSNALVILVPPKKDNYRFSFIHSSFEWKSDKNVKRIFSEPKRLSYYLGNEVKQFTPKQFLINKGKVKNFEDLKSRFDIEIVTDEFFEKYKALYLNFKKFLEKDENFLLFSKKKSFDIDTFAKRMIGQIVFCYFLQKKKWLGAKRSDFISDGDSNFLRNVYSDCIKKKKNFYNDYLEFIFYEGLNKKRSEDFLVQLECKIPFLNGGLFEPLEKYDWKNEFLEIPNEIFSNSNQEGILDIFDLYNFTVDEQSETEKEVAIDPEMLGKVFEKLLPENLRKSSGSYYTPRPIVSYLCKKSLIEYLYNNFKNKINFDKISNFIFNLSSVSSIEDFTGIAELEIKRDADQLLKSIDNIKICDPAVGSGAFLVTMLEIISQMKFYLLLFLKKEPEIYEIKKKFIEKSLHGVDLDPGAVEVAKLRLWLSLIVDEDDYSKIKSLPNFDYKIIQGNSLHNEIENISLELDTSSNRQLELGDVSDSKIDSLVMKLKEESKNYYETYDSKKKHDLKSNLMKTIYDLICLSIKRKKKLYPSVNIDNKKLEEQIYGFKNKDFFAWNIYFCNVFNEKKGFDLVIGNPPWRSLIGKQDKSFDSKSVLRKLKKRYLINTYMPNMYEFFLQLSYNLLNDNGILSFIVPDRLGFNYSSKIFREYFLEKTQILEIVYNWDFPEVVADTMTLIFKKRIKNDYKITIKNDKFSSKILFYKNEIKKDPNLIFRKYKSLKHKNLIEAIIKQSNHLENYAKVTSGFGGKSDLLTSERINKRQIEVYKGASIAKYLIKKTYYFELKDENITGRTRDINKLTIKEKVFLRKTGFPIIAAYDNTGIVPEESLYFIYNLDSAFDQLYILGLFNSNLIAWFASNYLFTNLESMPQLKIADVYQFPIKKVNKKYQLSIVKLVKDLIDNPNQKNFKQLIKKIDEEIYKIYEISEKDIKFIEKDLSFIK